MRVLLSTYGSRGDVEPMVGFAGALRALGVEVRVCAPPDFADLLARVGVPLVPAGQSVREMVRQVFTSKTPPSAADLAAGVIAGQADAVAGAAEGCDVLVAAGWADLTLIDDQDDCLAVGEVNQQALFRRVAAVVHHGGAGTTTTTARAGAPQVVVPQVADQLYWAARVADLGIGVAHDGPVPTAGSLSAALGTALTPETVARATAVAGTIRADGATVAAKLLLDAVTG